ncbi:DNA glycosylase [Russula earlei]|uniref:DNA glycosylase n=1 Tax=Russula earlei TaxID=71964 RepID=A0ACC0U983_9AGAM|nr:DNA glycosylase [Russula earlei]
MPVTRSISRARASAPTTSPAVIKRPLKRQAVSDSAAVTKRTKSSNRTKNEAGAEAPPRPLIEPSGEELAPLPAKLTFSLEDAKNHLIQADPRFGYVFSRLPCKPFERLESVHPFRSVQVLLCGQQISWLAARAIQHKFLRLYFPELPEKPDEEYWTETRQDVFPTAYQVAKTDLPTLKTAGLSGRKAEYVRDLATRFADGRLTNHKLFVASDEELFDLLTAVYGIGKWTVEMFAIFSLRRPDILPIGDLGVQRGLLRWVLSLHQREYRIEISPKKLSGPTESKSKPKAKPTKSGRSTVGGSTCIQTEMDSDSEREAEPEADELPGASALGTPLRPDKIAGEGAALTPGPPGLPSMPPPLTPSVTRALSGAPDASPPPPLPAGLTVASLRSRLDGKKKIKGAILTPSEMEAFTDSWRPYRSIAVYYMWALAEEKAES